MLFFPAPKPDISCKLTNTTNQSIPNNSLTMITWDTEEYDTDGMHTGSDTEIVIQTAGKYHVTAQVMWADNNTNSRFISIHVNGARVASVRRTAFFSSEDGVDWSGELEVNDTIELQVYQDSGGSLDFDHTGSTKPYLEAHKIN